MEELKNKIKNCHNDICIFNTKDYVLYEDALTIISSLQLENKRLKRDLKASESMGNQLAEHIEILNEKNITIKPTGPPIEILGEGNIPKSNSKKSWWGLNILDKLGI